MGKILNDLKRKDLLNDKQIQLAINAKTGNLKKKEK
jgi:hypothetical protein